MQTVLTSRKFWVTAIVLLAILVGVFVPEIGSKLEIKADDLGGAAALLATYVIALALDPGGGWKGLLQSRKFWAMLIGLVIMVLDMFQVVLPLGLTQEQIISICVTLGAYIVAVSVEGKLDLIDNATAKTIMTKRGGK